MNQNEIGEMKKTATSFLRRRGLLFPLRDVTLPSKLFVAVLFLETLGTSK
jgi:hypothetical protein